jgi:hypothetical protein
MSQTARRNVRVANACEGNRADTLGATPHVFWPIVEDRIRWMRIDPEPDQQRIDECLAFLIEWWQRATGR